MPMQKAYCIRQDQLTLSDRKASADSIQLLSRVHKPSEIATYILRQTTFRLLTFFFLPVTRPLWMWCGSPTVPLSLLTTTAAAEAPRQQSGTYGRRALITPPSLAHCRPCNSIGSEAKGTSVDERATVPEPVRRTVMVGIEKDR